MKKLIRKKILRQMKMKIYMEITMIKVISNTLVREMANLN